MASFLKHFKISGMLSIIDFLNFKLREVDKQLREKAKNIPEIEILCSIPGIGIYSVMVMYSEIGSIERFKAQKSSAHMLA